MTAPSSIDPVRFLHDELESASPDLLRSMLTTFVITVPACAPPCRGKRQGVAQASPLPSAARRIRPTAGRRVLQFSEPAGSMCFNSTVTPACRWQSRPTRQLRLHPSSCLSPAGMLRPRMPVSRQIPTASSRQAVQLCVCRRSRSARPVRSHDRDECSRRSS
jgi:hypothetical protein